MRLGTCAVRDMALNCKTMMGVSGNEEQISVRSARSYSGKVLISRVYEYLPTAHKDPRDSKAGLSVSCHIRSLPFLPLSWHPNTQAVKEGSGE